jgi:hypothetical protein
VASIIRSCQIDCKLTEEQLFQSEALGDGAAAGIVEEELAGTGEIAEAKAQTNPPPPRWRKPKLLWRLIKPRCEGLERGVVERNFCKKNI